MPPENKIPNSSEIDKALKEFEAKSGGSSVSVELPKVEQASQGYDSDVPAMVRLVMKWSGGTVNEKQAQYVLLGIVALMLGVSFYLFFGGSSSAPQPSAAQLQQMQQMMPPAPTQ